MKAMTRTVVGLVASSAIVVLLLLWVIVVYNRLVRRRNQVRAAWAQVDVQLKRRHDLIPNLVETVRGYTAHESATVQAVVDARARAVTATDTTQRTTAEGLLEQTLGRLLAVAEQYPELRASRNFHALQSELANTENKIAYARQFYNGAVQTYNTSVQSIPTNLVAGLTRFRTADLFGAGPDERDPVQVRF